MDSVPANVTTRHISILPADNISSQRSGLGAGPMPPLSCMIPMKRPNLFLAKKGARHAFTP